MAYLDQNDNAQIGFSGGEITVKCPNCGLKLSVGNSDVTISCPSCDNVYRASDLLRLASANNSTSQATSFNPASLALTIDTPESGLAYLDYTFENYDWEEFKQKTDLSIEEIDLMIEKNKIKNGANHAAWVLDFQGKYVPFCKKLEGLKDLEDKMASVYDPIDNTNALEYFDTYVLIVKSVNDNKENILKSLSMDIDYANKFGADTATCNDMTIKFNELKNMCDKVVEPEKIDDVQSVIAAKEKINNEFARGLALKGINASATYFEALNIFQSNVRDKSRALQLFESIKGYADSAEYVARLNKYFNYSDDEYDNGLFSFCGKRYVFKEEDAPVFDVDVKKKKKKNLEDFYNDDHSNMTTYTLYEVIDGIPSEEPLKDLTGLTKLLTCYSNKIFYIKNNEDLCCYDVCNYENTVIEEGRNGCFSTINGVDNFFLANTGKAFFLRKVLPLKLSSGCFTKIKNFFAKLFKRQKVDPHKNNYSILYVDMTKATASTLIDGLIDITDYHKDTLFYFVADNDPECNDVHFMECNVVSGNKKELLDDKCDVHDVINGKVVYTVWTPNDLNKNLYVYDLATGKNSLIEKNIYSYNRTINDRIFYTVGNKRYCPLFSNTTEGTGRIEIMQHVTDILDVRGDWMYIVKGHGRNKVLFKLSTDGEQKIVLCYKFKEIVEFTDSHIYYLDTDSALCVVRNDGLDDRKIAEDMKRENIMLSNNAIYYLRKEEVASNKNAFSLYKMDLSGHNSKKLMFNVDSFKDNDQDSLYLMREEKVKFEITTPTTLKESTVDYQKFDVTRYFKFDKKQETVDLVLSLGLPKADTFEFKSGCLRRKVQAKSELRELPPENSFKHRNVAEAGSTYQSQMDKVVAERDAAIAEQEAAKAAKKAEKEAKKAAKAAKNA